ncbi:hypothetical protein M0802_002145 [Mischocyttarus mexicanus]|nr:hypothetical protein M0802_002145 [Mischocyttarus mexicanus]
MTCVNIYIVGIAKKEGLKKKSVGVAAAGEPSSSSSSSSSNKHKGLWVLSRGGMHHTMLAEKDGGKRGWQGGVRVKEKGEGETAKKEEKGRGGGCVVDGCIVTLMRTTQGLIARKSHLYNIQKSTSWQIPLKHNYTAYYIRKKR